MADVEIVRCADEVDLLRVTVNGRYLAGFYGPDARAQAERYRDHLMEILACGDWCTAFGSAHHEEPLSPLYVSGFERALVH